MKHLQKSFLLSFALLCLLLVMPANMPIAARAADSDDFSSLKKSTVCNGSEFNRRLKQLANGVTATSQTEDKAIKEIVFLGTKDKAPTGNNIKKTQVGNGVTAYYNTSKNTISIKSTTNKIIFSDCRHMFYEFTAIEKITNKATIDSSAVTDMSYMFYDCENLVSQNLTDSFTTVAVNNMAKLFHGCRKLTSINVSGFDTSNVTDMDYMFYDCVGIEILDIRSFDTAKVTNMRGMFCACESMKKLYFSERFNTANVKNMSFMFNICEELESLDLSRFNTSKVTNMEYMFQACRRLKGLDLGSFDTSNVTNMRGMFNHAYYMTFKNIENLDVSKVTDVSMFFLGGQTVNSLDLSKYDFSSVYSAYAIFLENKMKILKSPRNLRIKLEMPAYFILDDNGDGITDDGYMYGWIPESDVSHRYIYYKENPELEKATHYPNKDNTDPVKISDDPSNPNAEAMKVYANPGDKTVEVAGITYLIHTNGTATAIKIPVGGKVKINTVSADGKKYPVTEIAANAAKGNKKIKSLTVGSNVAVIGKDAFKGCKKLSKVTIKANKALKVESGAFKKLSKKAIIRVKGVKGKTKKEIVKNLRKQTNAVVK